MQISVNKLEARHPMTIQKSDRIFFTPEYEIACI